jgi:gliding motility-associated-like protein
MKYSALSLLLFLCIPGTGYAQSIRNADGSPLATKYCYENTDVPLAGIPAGGTFSGCGVSIVDGAWTFNPVTASAGITVFPYTCKLGYTVNQQTVSVTILVQKPVIISPALEDSATCNGQFSLRCSTLYAGAYLYLWSPAAYLSDPDSSYTEGYIDQIQTFILTAEDLISGCMGTDTITITRHPIPEIVVKPSEITILAREAVTMEASGAATYQWIPDKWLNSDTAAKVTAYPRAPGKYQVVGTNEQGCKDTADVLVHINEAMAVPNAFSPNGDGINDVFRVNNVGYQGVEEYKIFNRYGQLVYETLDGTKGWDGTINNQPADAGSYHYLIRLGQRDGSPMIFKGDVILIR